MFNFQLRRSPQRGPYVRAEGRSADGRTVTVCIFDAKREAFERAIMARTSPGRTPNEEAHIVAFRGQWVSPHSSDAQPFFRVDGFDIFSGPTLELHRFIFQLGNIYQRTRGQNPEQALEKFRSYIQELIPGIVPLRMDNVYPLRSRGNGAPSPTPVRASVHQHLDPDKNGYEDEPDNGSWPPLFLRTPNA